MEEVEKKRVRKGEGRGKKDRENNGGGEEQNGMTLKETEAETPMPSL